MSPEAGRILLSFLGRVQLTGTEAPTFVRAVGELEMDIMKAQAAPSGPPNLPAAPSPEIPNGPEKAR